MTPFIVFPLSRDQVHTVFPLIREAIPGLSLSAWVRFARNATSRRRRDHAGIVVARREQRNFPSGLFCYRVDPDPGLGRVLVAEHFVALDLLHPEEVLAALVQELDALGKRLDCKAVRGIVHRPEVAGGLTKAGHAAVGSILGKPLTPGGVSLPAGAAA
jgi:hypothetical protein